MHHAPDADTFFASAQSVHFVAGARGVNWPATHADATQGSRTPGKARLFGAWWFGWHSRAARDGSRQFPREEETTLPRLSSGFHRVVLAHEPVGDGLLAGPSACA